MYYDTDTGMYWGIPEWLATGESKMNEQEIKNKICELKQELASLEVEQLKAKLPKTYSGGYFQVGINKTVLSQYRYPIVVPSNRGGTVETHDKVLTKGICLSIYEAREYAKQLIWFADWAENNLS